MTPDDEQERVAAPPRAPRSTPVAKRGGVRPASSSGAALAGGGFQFAASVLLFLFGGRWLDERFGTGPWLLVVGTFAGALLGFYGMFRTLTAAQRRGRRENDGE